MKIVARITVVLCFAWMGVWVLWGSTTSGYAWFLNDMARSFSEDNPKAALPLLVLAVPILVAGAVTALCWTSRGELSSSTPARWNSMSLGGRLRFLWSDERSLFLVFCIIPFVIFISSYVRRHLNKIEADDSGKYDDPMAVTNKTIMEQANAFAFVAVIGFNLLLILVARHSPLLAIVAWSRPHALIFHRWLGVTVILTSLLHGFLHIYRWIAVQHHALGYMITIPSECWQDWNGYEPECDDCDCHDHWKNVTGCLAAIPLLTILISSLEPVRRRIYRLFYAIHVIAAPLGLVMVIMHYSKAFLYLSGGILFYLASSMPVFVEQSCSRQGSPVTLSSAEQVDSPPPVDDELVISTNSDRPCVSLTVHVSPMALERYRAGQYVRLWCPEISREAHPFTISPVVHGGEQHNDNHGTTTSMRILFRQTGQFTKQLGHTLLQCEIPPRIFLEGFHGSPNRMDQLRRHDSVLILAGGIGITPYLSLLTTIRQSWPGTKKPSPLDQDNFTCAKVIQLHWICRDRGLIDYIRSEYLNRIVETVSGDYQIHCTIHYTGWATNEEFNCDAAGGREGGMAGGIHKQDFENPPTSVPFQPSKFAVGTHATYRGNIPLFLSFAAIGSIGMAFIWMCYTRWDDGSIVALLPLLILCLVVGGLVNRLLPDHGKRFTALSSLEEEEDVVFTDSANDHGSSELELTTKRTEDGHDDTLSDEFGDLSLSVPKHNAPMASSSFVRVEDGRPHVPHIVSQAALDTALCPGIFACGPKSLMQSVRGAVRMGGSLWPSGGCNCGDIAVYEEAFEL